MKMLDLENQNHFEYFGYKAVEHHPNFWKVYRTQWNGKAWILYPLDKAVRTEDEAKRLIDERISKTIRI